MKPNDIEVGKTYRNRGAGRTKRTVIDMGRHLISPPWFPENERPDEDVVLYKGKDGIKTLYLRSFASWVGSEVE